MSHPPNSDHRDATASTSNSPSAMTSIPQLNSMTTPSTAALPTDARPTASQSNKVTKPRAGRNNLQIHIPPKPKPLLKLRVKHNDNGSTEVITSGLNVDFQHTKVFKSRTAFDDFWSRVEKPEGEGAKKSEIMGAQKNHGSKGVEKEREGNGVYKEKAEKWCGMDLRKYVLRKRKRELEREEDVARRGKGGWDGEKGTSWVNA